MYKEKIVNHQTGEETWRDLNKDEVTEVEKAKAEAIKRSQFTENKEAARASALLKLAALGLTEEEIAAL